MATITKLSSGKFKAVVRRQGRTRSKTFTRKTDARTWAKRVESDRELMDALGVKGATLPFSELADMYERQWAGKDDSIGFKIQFWRDSIGRVRLIDIDRELIQGRLQGYAEGVALRGDGVDENGKPKLRNAGRARTPATVNRIKSTLSAIFKYAIGENLVKTNPVRGIPSRPENNKVIRFLSDNERTALLAACKESAWQKLYLLVVLALTTGARQGELLGLRWVDIDFARKQASLATTKNREPRVLPLPGHAMAALEPWREVGTGLVFPSELRPGQPFEFRKHWFSALKQAQIEHFRFHDLRHSAASYLVMNGATLNETAEILGHKNIQTTMRYAHLSTEHKAKLTERIFGGMSVDG